ncbi:MAG: hypothetical protein JXA91_00800 [Candidatus Thermoplasmatota archaeon]|nr:hypothetical protein [Candidatus Thermoplasmatota archaeon]
MNSYFIKRLIVGYVILIFSIPLINCTSATEISNFTEADCACPELGMDLKYAHAQKNEMFKARFEKSSGHSRNTTLQHETWANYITSEIATNAFNTKVNTLKENTYSSIKNKSYTHEDYVITEELFTEDTASFIYGDYTLPNLGYDSPPKYTGYRHVIYRDIFIISLSGDYFESSSDIANAFSTLESCVKAVIDSKVGEEPEAKILKGRITGIGKLLNLVKLYDNHQLTKEIAERGATTDIIPMKHMKLVLRNGNNILETTTDAQGNYSFTLHDYTPGKNYELDIKFSYESEDTTFFTIYYQDENRPIIITQTFTVNSDADLTHDIKLDEIFKPQDGTIAFVYMYHHLTEVVEYYTEYLKENIEFQLPVKVCLFVQDSTITNNALYKWENSQSYIYISSDYSNHMNYFRNILLYHEFSHYVMHALYKTMPEGINTPVTMVNHDGYINPSTADSFSEAFAIFMSLVIAQHYNTYEEYRPDSCILYMDLEDNWKAWDIKGKAEEYAIAGVLWDLYDGENEFISKRQDELTYELNMLESGGGMPGDTREKIEERISNEKYDDDNIDLTFDELWQILRNPHDDFTELATSLLANFSSKKSDIEGILIKHGCFADNNTGNKIFDKNEPVRDNYFIDLPSNIVWNESETIGQITNYERPWRTSTVPLPGFFIKVGDDITNYILTYHYTNEPYFKNYLCSQSFDNLLYVPLPPSEYNVTVTLEAAGVETTNPLTYTSKDFYDNYSTSLEQGYYREYDCITQGEIPAAPVIPDYPFNGQDSNDNGTPGFEVILFICALVLVLLFLRRRKF